VVFEVAEAPPLPITEVPRVGKVEVEFSNPEYGAVGVSDVEETPVLRAPDVGLTPEPVKYILDVPFPVEYGPEAAPVCDEKNPVDMEPLLVGQGVQVVFTEGYGSEVKVEDPSDELTSEYAADEGT
jgi:hypothetical protein